MIQTDLYALLLAYSGKTKSLYIDIRGFLDFIRKYAIEKVKKQQEWKLWAGNARAQFNMEISSLVESGQCIILTDNRDGHIFMAECCREKIETAWQHSGDVTDASFPVEQSLGQKMPAGFTRTVNLLTDTGRFFRQPIAFPPENVLILQFPQDFGRTVILASMIPQRLMEISLIKIQYYLNTHHSSEYVINKMTVLMQGKEKALEEIITRIKTRPQDCLNDLNRLDDFAYIFWIHICPLIKEFIKKHKDLTAMEWTILQAASVIEICSAHYRSAVMKKRDVEAAFATLEELMDRPPWHYTIEEITTFSNNNKIPLLRMYSRQELEVYIRKAISVSTDGGLPPWLAIKGDMGERWYVKKEKYIDICLKMLSDARTEVINLLTKRWTKMIEEFSRESAMEKDADFEKLLKRLSNTVNPFLQDILDDSKLQLASIERDRGQQAESESPHIFINGLLAPYSNLYNINRKNLLADIKATLPLWYSSHFLRAIAAVMDKLLRKNKKSSQEEDNDTSSAIEKEQKKLQQNILQLQSAIVPGDTNPQKYLTQLEQKWGHLRDKETRKNMVSGIHNLTQDYLRRLPKLNTRYPKISRADLKEMSSLLVTRNTALSSLKDQVSLRLYIELYALEFLLSRNK